MISKDPVMLLSFVNTQLRDNYSSFDDFCAAFGVQAEDIISKLDGINYVYDKKLNQFK